MELILILTLATAGAVITGLLLQRHHKLTWIKNKGLVDVSGASDRYPHLPLKNYGMAMEVRDQNRVKVVFPRLTHDGDVEYLYSWHSIHDIKIPKSNSESRSLRLQLAEEVTQSIQEHLQIEPEILQLEQEQEKLERLANLIASSEFYWGYLDPYERASDQIETLISKARALRNIYVRIIRETLIGAEMSTYTLNEIPSQMAVDAQYQQLRAEYDQIKQTAIAYPELMQVIREAGEV